MNYITCFIFMLYMAFVGHYYTTESKEVFLKNYSLTSLYFFIGLLLWLTVSKYLSQIKSDKKIVNEIKSAVTPRGVIIMPLLILSHIVAIINPLDSLSHSLSELFRFNQQIIILSIGAMLFTLGLSLWKKSDKKLLIPILMVLFIHGFYQVILWNSTVQQMKIKEDVYKIAVEKKIRLKECNQGIVCSVVKKEDFLNHIDKIEPPLLRSHVSQYMHSFSGKISNSKTSIVSLSFPEGITGFRSRYYQPIGVYDKSTGYFLLDYSSMFAVTNVHVEVYYKITGVAGIFWLYLTMLSVAWHYFVRHRWIKKNYN